MPNPIHQWIDVVTTRIEDQRRTSEKQASDLDHAFTIQAGLREAVARLQAQGEANDRLVQSQIKGLEDKCKEHSKSFEEQRRDHRRFTAKMFTVFTGVIGVLAGLVQYFLGD